MDDEWAKTINEELGTDLAVAQDEPEVKEPIENVEEPTKEPDTEPEEPKETDEEEEAGDKAPKEDEPSEPTPAPAPESEPKVEPPTGKDEPEEKFAPKEVIKEALKELETETRASAAEREAMKAGVLDALYPEGINRQLLDSDGDPINGIEDLVKLINPKTNDYFTEDEAGSWLLAKQKQLNKEIEELENYAGDIVDTNISLKDGADRVEEIYGDLLTKLPDVADKVLEAYQKTLIKDPKTGLVIKAPVDVVEFYNIALSGYKQMADQMSAAATAQAKEAEAAAAEKAKTVQSERSDLHPKGSSELPLSEDEAGWDEAMDRYYNNKK